MEESSNFQGDEDLMSLTGRLLDFAPGVNGEQLTEEQETALKKATFYFYKQLMLQQNKSSIPVRIDRMTPSRSSQSVSKARNLFFFKF